LISLAVKDISKSHDFCKKLGTEQTGGDQAQGWLVLKGPTAVIGLFQGMFETNIMTFVPGWDENSQGLGEFTVIRDLQKAMKAAGLVH
jgi:lactoylglutathione lyase